MIQRQAEAEDAGNATMESDAYNGHGWLQRQSLPYQVAQAPGAGYLPVSDWSALAHTRTEYDPFGRITAVVQANGLQKSYGYRHLQVAEIDEKGAQTVRLSDGLGRLVQVEQYEGQYSAPDWGAASYFDAAYEYDVTDNLRFVRDRNQVTTEMQYDALGRKTQMDEPNLGLWGYAYDDAGNLIRQTDARQQSICFYYDALRRLIGKTYRNDTACPATAGAFAIAYTYDEAGHGSSLGRRTGMADASGSTAWSYDLRGRVTGETKTIDGVAYTTAYSYDAMDRLQVLTYPDAAAEQLSHSYNPQGLLESVTGLKPYVLSSSYDEASRLTGRVLQNNEGQNWTTAYSYYAWTDPILGRLQSLVTSGTKADATATFQDLSYSYDAVGNVKTIVDGSNSAQRQCFNYDELDRLVHGYTGNSGCTAYEAAGNGPYEEQYTLAANGNLDLRKIVSPAYQEISYTYNAPSPGGCTTGTAATKPHAVSQAGSNSYSYDCNGNMTGRTIGATTPYTLSYDAENRLISVTGGITVTFTYDGDGNRVKKDVDGVVTHYPGRHYEATLGSGFTKYYFADGQLVTLERSPEYGNAYGRRYVFRDHLGSTSIIVNGQGVGLWEDRYLPFGDVRYHSDTVTNTVQTQTLRCTQGYTGQWLEEGLAANPEGGLDRGLYFYGARWYDASLGRFVQPDTIVPEPNNPQMLNRYTYSANNPIKYTDPSGNCTVDENGNIALNDAGEIAETNCTVDMFQALTWAQREQWLQLFVQQFDLDGWFNDISGAIGYLAGDPNFSQMDSRIAYMDAAVLQAINDGMRLFNGKSTIGFGGATGGGGWRAFFEAHKSWRQRDLNLNPLIAVRLNAEQQGVNYAKGLPEAKRRYDQADDIDQMHMDVFLWGADAYRSIAPDLRETPIINSLTVSATDPRTSWGTLRHLGDLARPAASFLWGQLHRDWGWSP